ncbi:DNA polymerase III subunit gamma/tau [Flavobacterium sp. Root420]|uniref:DNA polymerase III subunit gamma/tau n=1 Tax=Flavobacterium sp. Root420 TaxID=1736533 RepID=UPI000A73796E|nr:DNA polymerase III subunit gamma/tau [Flavobacterium sp. Root420]
MESGNINTSAEAVNVDVQKAIENPVAEVENQNASDENQPKKVSAFSLASIRAKKEMEEKNRSYVKPSSVLPTEDFTETEMLVQWNKYAQRLGDKGHKIMESLLLINDPKLNGTVITLELPNEGSKLDFEGQINGLLGHLKGHLHNHDITIELIVNEAIETKRSFNDQDRYNRLLEINPNIELLRSTFGLDLLG